MSSSAESRKILFQSKILFLMSVCQIVTVLCVIVMMFNDYRNSPLQCLIDKDMRAIETFCYIQSVFTLKGMGTDAEHKKIVGKTLMETPSHQYQKYFFWLPYLLWGQVLLLGFPRYLWKTSENGFMARFLQSVPNIPSTQKLEPLAKYFYATMSHYRIYALKFLCCELLGLVILVLNLFLTNWYLEGRFFTEIPALFYQLLFTSRRDGYSLLDETFPKVAKCSFYLFGLSGTVMLRDSLCILGRNLLTGRIYILLFVLYTTSAVISTMSFAWRAITFLSPNARIFSLLKKAPACAKENISCIMMYCDFGDWFFLQQMCSSVANFHIFVDLLRQKLQEKEDAEAVKTIQLKAQKRINALYEP